MNRLILVKQLELHEGKKQFPYKDTVGKITIGVGRNLTDVGLSNNEINLLLQNDIQKCIQNLDAAFPWWAGLSDARQHVVIDMIFNLGLAGLSKFIRTLEATRIGEYDLAADRMLQSLWAKQVDQRAKRLSEMMRSDIFPVELR